MAFSAGGRSRSSHRYPYAPLLGYVSRRRGFPQTGSMMAKATGACERTIERWKTNGLTLSSADTAANAVGSHIDEIWGDE